MINFVKFLHICRPIYNAYMYQSKMQYNIFEFKNIASIIFFQNMK